MTLKYNIITENVFQTISSNCGHPDLTSPTLAWGFVRECTKPFQEAYSNWEWILNMPLAALLWKLFTYASQHLIKGTDACIHTNWGHLTAWFMKTHACFIQLSINHNAMQYTNFSKNTTSFYLFRYISWTIYSSVQHKQQCYIGTDEHNKNTARKIS